MAPWSTSRPASLMCRMISLSASCRGCHSTEGRRSLLMIRWTVSWLDVPDDLLVRLLPGVREERQCGYAWVRGAPELRHAAARYPRTAPACLRRRRLPGTSAHPTP